MKQVARTGAESLGDVVKCIPRHVNSYLASAPAWQGPVFHPRILVLKKTSHLTGQFNSIQFSLFFRKFHLGMYHGNGKCQLNVHHQEGYS
jgi:hypothetical protein